MQVLFSFKKSGLVFQNEMRKYFEDNSISLKMKANVINYLTYGYGNNSIFSSIDVISEQATPAYGQILCKTNINQFNKFKITMTDSWDMLNYLGFNSIVNNVVQTLKTYYEVNDEDEINKKYNKAINILYRILNDTLMYKKFNVCNYNSYNELTFFEYCINNLYYEHERLSNLIDNITGNEGRINDVDIKRKYNAIYNTLLIHNSLYSTILPTIEFVYESEKDEENENFNNFVSYSFGKRLTIDEVVKKIESITDKEFTDENINSKLNNYKDRNINKITKLVYAVSDYSIKYLQYIYNYMKFKLYPFVEIVCNYDDQKFKDTNRNMTIIPQIKIVNNNTDVYIYTNCSICYYYSPKCTIVSGTHKEKMIGYNYNSIKRYINEHKNDLEYQNAYIFITNRRFRYMNLRPIKTDLNIDDDNNGDEDINENEIIEEEQDDYNNEQIYEEGETNVLSQKQLILKNCNGIVKIADDGKRVFNDENYIIVSQNDIVLTFNEFNMMKPPIKRDGTENEARLYSFENKINNN